MKVLMIATLIIGITTTFAEQLPVRVRFQNYNNVYCTRFVHEETVASSELVCAKQCKSKHRCRAYSYRGSTCVLHRKACKLSTLKKEIGAHYAEVHWKCYQSSCYNILSMKSPLSTKWDAEAHCETLDAHVLRVETVEETELIQELLSQAAYAWLNLTLNGDRWYYGGEQTSYLNWAWGEPDGLGEECAAVYRYNGKWYDRPCSWNATILCEKEKSD